jgi:SOS-response transcriptional repressor LexA
MNSTQESLKELSKNTDLKTLSIREIGRRLGSNGKELHPETVKYHWKKLFDAGEVTYLYDGRTNLRRSSSIAEGLSAEDMKLVAIPIYGKADCGPATKVADQEDLGTLRISSRLLNTSNYASLYALQASGSSMNQAVVNGHAINDGDYVIVDSRLNSPRNGDCVVAIVDGLANIKKFYREKDRIALLSESTKQYDPIFIHPEDQSDSLIGGKVIQVIEKVNMPHAVN